MTDPTDPGNPEETAYDALSLEADDPRWAFGTGFTDPLAGMDTSVPEGVDAADLTSYCLMLGDDALVLSQRLQEWISRLPELEEEAAVANIALDLLGQARLLLSRAAAAENSGRTEDDFAYRREQHEFLNVRLVELADADFAEMVTRLLVFSTFRLAVLQRLRVSRDPVLAAVAGKASNEVIYHRDYAGGWVVRLGDGTDASHERMLAALDAVWPYVDELFQGSAVERRLTGVAADPAEVRDEVEAVLEEVLSEATLKRPDVPPAALVSGRTGRDGTHTEALSYILAEMQSVARAHPGAEWGARSPHSGWRTKSLPRCRTRNCPA
jgi:ring-1,2-phenylacetyl-CoA epoxidase subunit PaaC